MRCYSIFRYAKLVNNSEITLVRVLFEKEEEGYLIGFPTLLLILTLELESMRVLRLTKRDRQSKGSKF